MELQETMQQINICHNNVSTFTSIRFEQIHPIRKTHLKNIQTSLASFWHLTLTSCIYVISSGRISMNHQVELMGMEMQIRISK